MIERESRLIDPSVLQALLKTDPVDLAETASAEAALAALRALLPADSIDLSLTADEKTAAIC